MTKSIGRADVAKAAGVSETTVPRALNDSPLIISDIKSLVRDQVELYRCTYLPMTSLLVSKKVLELMENYLQKYPKIHAVYCQDDDVMTGVLQAIKESGPKESSLYTSITSKWVNGLN